MSPARRLAAVLAVALALLVGCTEPEPPTPLPTVTAAPLAAPATTTTTPPPSTSTSTSTPRKATTPKAKSTTKAKAKRPRLSCEPGADARLVGDEIVNKACPANPAKDRADRAFASCPDAWNVDKQRCLTKAERRQRDRADEGVTGQEAVDEAAHRAGKLRCPEADHWVDSLAEC